MGESLRSSQASLELSRRLATLQCDVPLEQTPESLVRREPQVERLRELYTRLELRSLLRQLNESDPADAMAADAVGAAAQAPVEPQ